MSFIDYRLYPGGPGEPPSFLVTRVITLGFVAGFQVDFFALPVNAMANVAAAMANWLSEGLIV